MSQLPMNRLAPVKPVAQRMVVTAADPIESWPTSLEVGSARWKACLVNAQCTPDYHLDAGESRDFVMVDWLIQWTSRVKRGSNEVSEFSQLVLFDHEGNTLASSGEYVGEHLQKVLKVYSKEDLKRGIKVRLQARTGKNGYVYHQLKVVPEG